MTHNNEQLDATMTSGAANETPVPTDRGSVTASHDNEDSLLASPEMDGASFEALMKERTRVRWDPGGR